MRATMLASAVGRRSRGQSNARLLQSGSYTRDSPRVLCRRSGHEVDASRVRGGGLGRWARRPNGRTARRWAGSGSEEGPDGDGPSASGNFGEEFDQASPEEATSRWGLEAGLFKIFFAKGKSANDTEGTAANTNKGLQAKDLLKRFGAAYLITSITLAIISFSTCYALVRYATSAHLRCGSPAFRAAP